MRRRLRWLAVAAFLVPMPVLACLWDSDTLKQEMKRLPGVGEIITGRFERNPPLYYEMRLKRVADELKADPSKLELYDDAGVACDRLGKGDEAIVWMEKKKARLDSGEYGADATNEHLYRYHANLGTFLAHAWFRKGADRTKLEELRAGRDHIAKAIEINPNAHFGREKYQLLMMDRVIDPSTRPAVASSDGLSANEPRESFIGTRHGLDKGIVANEAVTGLTGLIVLGNAWESVDVFRALAIALGAKGDRSLSYLATMRERELIEEGRESIAPGALNGEERIKQLLPRAQLKDDGEGVLNEFYRLRKEADAWAKARTDFMLARLRAGRHPDTDATFWSGFRAAPVEIPEPPPSDRALVGMAIVAVVVLLTLFAAVVGVLVYFVRLLSRRPKPIAERALWEVRRAVGLSLEKPGDYDGSRRAGA